MKTKASFSWTAAYYGYKIENTVKMLFRMKYLFDENWLFINIALILLQFVNRLRYYFGICRWSANNGFVGFCLQFLIICIAFIAGQTDRQASFYCSSRTQHIKLKGTK